jgi:putative oxidoreductase
MNLLNLLPIMGKCFIGFYFAGTGLFNISQWRLTLTAMIEKNIPLPFLVLPLGIFWEISAGTMIMFNSYVKLAALSLIVFTVIGITMFHDFWNHEGEVRKLNRIIFIANLTISIGALLILANNITPVTSLSELFS